MKMLSLLLKKYSKSKHKKIQVKLNYKVNALAILKQTFINHIHNSLGLRDEKKFWKFVYITKTIV